jgi:peptidoglycan/LPS O-acetylase OafA/YrhL
MPYRFFAVDFFVGLGAIAVLIISARSPYNPMRRVLSWRPLVFLGTISYSLYLIHAPLLQVVWQAAVSGFFQSQLSRFVVLCVLGVPFIVACSWVFYRTCEKPFMPR